MRYVNYCDICGQELTEASGKQKITISDFGIYHRPTERVECCAYCREEVDKLFQELSEKRRKERNEAR